MEITFPFEEQETKIFDKMKRPVAEVLFWSEKLQNWVPVKMVVDTGADYTLLPSWLAEKLGIKLGSDCKAFFTVGVGGSQRAYISKKNWRVKLKNWEGKITLGFITDHNIPPLLGRRNFLEKLEVIFKDYKTTFVYDTISSA